MLLLIKYKCPIKQSNSMIIIKKIFDENHLNIIKKIASDLLFK